MRLTFIIAALVFVAAGCAHHATPVGRVPESDRAVVAQGPNEPRQIRILRPISISGVALPANSTVLRLSADTYHLVPAAPTEVESIPVPAHSAIELVKTSSLFVGERYVWNGVVFAGGPVAYGPIQAEQGDRLYFSGKLGAAKWLSQLHLAKAHQVKGREYPPGTILDVSPDGTIHGVYTPAAQAALAEQRRAGAEHAELCAQRCAIVTNAQQNALCLQRCASEVR
jgi:hypothetical protein